MMTAHFSDYVQSHLHPKTIFVVGGGPSLNQHDLAVLNQPEHFVICCNQAFSLIPSAKIAHHSDYAWWEQYQSQLESQFTGDFITGCGLGNTKAYPDVVTHMGFIQHHNLDDLFRSAMYVYGNNCGLQALSIAHLFQPQNIVLIGFDFKAENGQSHGYEKNNLASMEHYQSFWLMFLRGFTDFEKIKATQWQKAYPNQALPAIWNVNPDSALTLYDKSKSLSDFL